MKTQQEKNEELNKIIDIGIKKYYTVDEYKYFKHIRNDEDKCPECGGDSETLSQSVSEATEYIQVCKKCKLILSSYYDD